MSAKKLANIMVGLLILQFLLGILANLYSTIPKHKPYTVFDHFGFILFHALNGVLLLGLAIVFAVKTGRNGPFKKEIMGGLGSIVTAFVFGELFVFTNNDIFSFLMAGAFMGALINYAKIAYASNVQ